MKVLGVEVNARTIGVAIALLALVVGVGAVLVALEVLPGPPTQAVVAEVVSGDSFRTQDGRVVRLIAVDAPFPGRPMADEAKALLQSLATGKNLRLELCDVRPTDAKGRVPAFVFADDVSVNRALLERGFAAFYPDAKCLGDRRADLFRVAREAYDARRGVWKDAPSEPIDAAKALASVKLTRYVRGRIAEVRAGKAVTILVADGGFRFVVFGAARSRFARVLPEPLDGLIGGTVVAWGRIQEYRGGPEMVLDDPSQVVSVATAGNLRTGDPGYVPGRTR